MIVSLLQGNDLRDLLKRIEQGLHSLHSQARETAMDSESAAARTAEEAGAPFARVMVVVNGSPADKAGIKQGDLVIKFGTVSKVGSPQGKFEGNCFSYLSSHHNQRWLISFVLKPVSPSF